MCFIENQPLSSFGKGLNSTVTLKFGCFLFPRAEMFDMGFCVWSHWLSSFLAEHFIKQPVQAKLPWEAHTGSFPPQYRDYVKTLHVIRRWCGRAGHTCARVFSFRGVVGLSGEGGVYTFHSALWQQTGGRLWSTPFIQRRRLRACVCVRAPVRARPHTRIALNALYADKCRCNSMAAVTLRL